MPRPVRLTSPAEVMAELLRPPPPPLPRPSAERMRERASDGTRLVEWRGYPSDSTDAEGFAKHPIRGGYRTPGGEIYLVAADGYSAYPLYLISDDLERVGFAGGLHRSAGARYEAVEGQGGAVFRYRNRPFTVLSQNEIAELLRGRVFITDHRLGR